MTRRLVLASASPLRAEMLAAHGYEFTVRPAPVDEQLRRGELPAVAAMRLAYAKANTVAAHVPRGDVVLGVDTMIDLDGNPVGKPGSPPQATRMLSRLSGRTHEVVSGFAVVLAGRGRATLGVARTAVRFHHLGFEEITAYVATGEPLDRAGAYAIQAAGAALVAEVTGSTANVAGLPLEALGPVLTDYGVAAAGPF